MFEVGGEGLICGHTQNPEKKLLACVRAATLPE